MLPGYRPGSRQNCRMLTPRRWLPGACLSRDSQAARPAWSASTPGPWVAAGHGLGPASSRGHRSAQWLSGPSGSHVCVRVSLSIAGVTNQREAEKEGAPRHSAAGDCDRTVCSLPGFSVHGIFQARILERVAFSYSRGSSRPRNRTRVSCPEGATFTVEPPEKPREGWGRGSCQDFDWGDLESAGGRTDVFLTLSLWRQI